MADMIQIKGLNKYFGDLHVLKDVNLNVKEGEKLVIIGPSGSGKSTLIRCVDFLEEPTTGEVVIDGTVLTKKNHLEMARKYSSMVFQQFNLYPNMTVLGNLTLAPIKLQKKSKEEANKIAMAALERVGLANKAGEYPQNLSGGQQQRVAIARALITKPSLVFADEPTGNLDSVSSAEVLSFLKRSVKELGQTVIMVTHDAVAASYADRAIVFADGQIVADEQRPTAESMNQLLMNEREWATQLVGGPSAGTTVPRPPVAALKGHTEKASFVPGAPSVPGAPQHAAVAQHRR